MSDPVDDGILVDRSTEVGSAALAAALEATDVAAIGRALRHDYVVVPQLRSADGELQVRVFESEHPEGATPYELCLFSSTEALAAYLGDNEDREFALQRGAALVPFLEQYRAVIERVVFDPAGPHPMMAIADDVLASLRPQPGDDDVAWVASAPGGGLEEAALPLDPRASTVVGLDIALSREWFVIELEDAAARDEQVSLLVRRQLSALAPSPVLRAELERWLRESCARAATAGGRFLAYLLQRNETAALAINVAMYWHALGPAIGDVSHLDRLAAKLRSELSEGAELVGAETLAGPFIRHSRVGAGAAELGATETPLLLVDYWLQFPDLRGLCLLSFSSPHVAITSQLLLLMDNIVLTGAWVLETDQPR
ncbi:hypothetical protein BH10ACT4_BH10ACT4_04890 [soil metagenome]